MAVTSATGSSGLDVASIVSQLMTVEQRPLASLATKEASIQAKLSALGSVKGALSSFQGVMARLSNINQLQSLTAASSDSTKLTASAANTAVAGTYAINVTSLAQSQQLLATGQASQTAAIGLGGATTLTFDFGTTAGATFTSSGAGTKTVSISAANNSLQGIRDAINAANIGVTAAIINDGSANPYRLTLSSTSPGASNSMKISVAGDAALTGLLAYDPAGAQNLTQTQVAQNANFTVNGVAISKPSNSVSDVINGVALNLLQTTATPINLSVTNNNSAVSTAAGDFVKAYNDLHTAINSVSAYDPVAKKGAILQGDFTVRTIASQVHGILNTTVAGAGTLTTFSDIGISFQKDGTVTLDSAKLNTAIANNSADVAALFGAVGKASDSLVSYTSATSATKPGSYAVNVTTLAAQGNTVGNVNLNAASTVIAANTVLNVTVDNIATQVALTAGTYTAAQLAAMVQSAINGASAFSSVGSSVVATVNAGTGFMTIASNRYSSTSNVSLAALTGTLPSAFMGAAVNTSGQDVAGTIDGVAATGSGQRLTSASGNSNGLAIQINGGATGARGTINYSQGYAYQLNQLATSLLATNGLLDSKTSGLNSSITDIGKQRDALNSRLAIIQKNYTKQFSALDAMLSSMNNTQTYLTQQLANLPKMN